MTPKYALVKQEEGKLFCYFNEEDKPYPADDKYSGENNTYLRMDYEEDLERWRFNHKRFEVHKDHEYSFINECRKISIEKGLANEDGSFLPALKLGIEIPAERILIKSFVYDTIRKGDRELAILLPDPTIKDFLIVEDKVSNCPTCGQKIIIFI